VALAFRNGPIESIHAGCVRCPGCRTRLSKITDEEMKRINKSAMNRVWTLLRLRERNPKGYRALVQFGFRTYAAHWDPPEIEGF
jgi:hypothetical protein